MGPAAVTPAQQARRRARMGGRFLSQRAAIEKEAHVAAEYPIPRDLEEAFAEALVYFAGDWSPADPENECISIGRSRGYSISAVCEFVDNFDDDLPAGVKELLLGQMHAQHHNLRLELDRTASYAVGARWLRRLLGDRVAAYQRLEELRREHQ
jgi:hypothetical protein